MRYVKTYEDIEWGDFDDFYIEEDEPINMNVPNSFIGNEDFYNFLKDNDIYNEYVSRYDRYFLRSAGSDLKTFLETNSKKYFIDSAFPWFGDEKWFVINKKWLTYIE